MEKRKIKIAVMVSGGGTNLQALIDAQNSGIIKNGEIAMVISNNPNAFALTRAENAGVPYFILSHKQFESKKTYEKELIKIIDRNNIDLVVLAGFMYILTPVFVNHYKMRILNIHPSLIPSFCGKGFYGLHVHEAALARGVKISGCTVHFVNEEPDGGPIVMQKAVSVHKNDTPEKLQQRIMVQGEWNIYPLSVEKVCGMILEGEI